MVASICAGSFWQQCVNPWQTSTHQSPISDEEIQYQILTANVNVMCGNTQEIHKREMCENI